MKKLILIILVSLAFLKADAQANAVCCPEKFELKQLINDRQCDLLCDSSFKDLGTAVGQIPPNGPVQGQKPAIVACKNSQMTYLVIPNLPGFTYTWVVTGGIVSSPNPGNPVTINWGNVTKGSIVVTISNADGSCVRKIAYDICLQDKPVANFTFNPSSPVCINNLIQFNNTSLGGATYFWDFGDGQTSTDVNPQHTYTTVNNTPGYVVTLVVKSKSYGCGCTDTIRQTIVVNDGPGISGCDKMLCPGDTATYCSTKTCGSYSWSIPAGAGTIIGSSTQNCVRIAWSNTQPGTLPATITLTTSGCGACNITTLPVNIVWPALPIQGNTVVCVGSTETYSLPVMPGTFYSWSLSGGGIIVNSGMYPTGYPVNNPQININWNLPGTYNLTVNYNNPNTKKKCGGSYTLSITVKPKFKIMGMTSVCAGTTGIYMTQDFSLADWTVTGGVLGTNYTFATGPNGVSTFQVNWITSGVYQLCGQPITANIPNYCNANPVCVSVLVKPTPVVTVGGSNLVCPGVLTNYIASSTPPGSNFTWSVSPALAQAPAPYGTYDENASIIFNGTAPWTVTASTTLNGCVGSNIIIVNQVPAPTLPVTPLTACIGGQVTITASGIGPFIWSTSPAASLISPQGNNPATYELHGSGTITVSNCSGPSNAVSVTATLPPTITTTTTGSLCAGNLQLQAPAGGTYLWTGGSTAQFINVTIPGSYTVVVTFPGGCKSVATYTVAPVPLPTVTISTGDPLIWCNPLTPNVNLTAFTLGVGCTYQWYKVGFGAVGTNSPTYNATMAGSYYVVITCGGCVATSNTITVIQQNCVPVPGCASPIPPNPFGTIVITGCNPKTFTISGLNPCPGGIVSWTFGDGGTATGTIVTHTYANAGAYGVTASMTCNGCTFTIISTAQVAVKADFNSSVSCGLNGSNTIVMNNTSQVLGGWTMTSVSWASSCGTPPTGTGNTYTLNTLIGCSPTVTMTITVTNTATGQVCTDVKTFSFSFASSPLTINGPTTVCKNQTYNFNSSMTGIQYQWTVNGTPVSQNNPLSYAFNGVPTNPVLGLTVTDAFGCTFNTSVTLNVVTPPSLSITPSPIIKVCQAPCLTTGSVITATAGFTNYEWFQNGVSLGAPSGSNTYTITGPSPIGTYYVQAQSLPNLCNVKSNTVSVVYHPKPQTQIIANTNNCIANVPFNLTSAPSFPSVSANLSFTAGYNYEWFLNNLSTPINNSNTTNYLTYTINSFGTYTFIVRVTDAATGCCNLDTICIAFSQNPTVSIVPGGPLCQGAPVTLNATAGPNSPASYYYAWENGQTGQTHVVQAAGMYGVMAMDNYGCSASAFVTIKPLPYVALFPQGCDTICLGDTNKLQFPLPTNTFGQPTYTIVWSLPGGVGTTFPLSTLGLGSHTITATVTMNGCTATTGAYNVFVKNCDTCNCKESYWKDGPLWTNINTGEQIKIDCKKEPFQYVIQGDHCKDSFMLSGTYICKGKDCPGKVVYSLYDANTNNYIGGGTGSYTIPFNLPNGSYYITIYAYCGDLKCDSCKINIKKDCDKGCDCNKPGVEIEPVLTINKATKKIKCGDHFEVSCLSNVTLTANYFCIPSNCPATISYQLTGPISQTGNLPLSLSGLPAGSYSIILMAYCGGKLCKECKLNFEVVCEKDCCPYDIKATLQSQATSMSPGNTNLLVNQAFNFTGLTGASLTEIRAEVLSYNLTSQFPEQCIGCKNLPKGWASIYDGNVMGPVIPKVNLAGVMTNAPLNVPSLSAYSNPREIVWNNGGSIFSIVQPVTVGFILPKPSPLDCCDATAEICVKFTFRDKDCKECEVIICFKVVIKKK